MIRLITLRLLESYFRHRWLYLLPIVLMIAIGAAYYFFIAKPVYIVEGVLYVQGESLLSSLISVRDEPFAVSTPAEATSDEVVELLQTNAFIRSLIAESKLEGNMDGGPDAVQETIGEVREAVWVDPQGRNQVLVAAAHEDPEVAHQLATAMVDNYIQWRINAERRESATAKTFFDNLIEQYQSDLEQARQELELYLEAHPEPLRGARPAQEQLEITRLESAIDLAQTRYQSVLQKEENASLTMAQTESSVRQTYYLIDAPAMPVEPATSLRRQVRNVALFGIVGGLLSLLGIIGGALLDRSPRFPLDVEHATGLPVLAMIPVSDPDRHPEEIVKSQRLADARGELGEGRKSRFAYNRNIS